MTFIIVHLQIRINSFYLILFTLILVFSFFPYLFVNVDGLQLNSFSITNYIAIIICKPLNCLIGVDKIN